MSLLLYICVFTYVQFSSKPIFRLLFILCWYADLLNSSRSTAQHPKNELRPPNFSWMRMNQPTKMKPSDFSEASIFLWHRDSAINRFTHIASRICIQGTTVVESFMVALFSFYLGSVMPLWSDWAGWESAKSVLQHHLAKIGHVRIIVNPHSPAQVRHDLSYFDPKWRSF